MLTQQRSFDYVAEFIQECQYRGLSPATIKDYNWHLNDIKNRLDNAANIDRGQIKQLILERMNSGLSPASANHYIRSIKAFYTFLHNEGHIEKNIMQGLPLVSEPAKLKPVIEIDKISRLVGAIPDNTFYSARDKTMIIILWDTAIRLKELLNIKIEDIEIRIGSIHVTGKGNKDRIVPIGRKSKLHLIKYMAIRGDNHSEYLFATQTGYPIGARNFQRTLERYGRRLGLKLSPHLLRHSAATFLAKSGMPAQHLQVLLGHTSLHTTQRYINRILNQEGLRISHRQFSPGDRI